LIQAFEPGGSHNQEQKLLPVREALSPYRVLHNERLGAVIRSQSQLDQLNWLGVEVGRDINIRRGHRPTPRGSIQDIVRHLPENISSEVVWGHEDGSRVSKDRGIMVWNVEAAGSCKRSIKVS
jgi:hypothetical protein